MTYRSLCLSLFAAALLSEVGCSVLSPQTDTTRYYVLTAYPPKDVSTPPPNGPAVGIGPIHFPGYLDRSELVSRPSLNELHVATNDDWAEPLSEGFRRTLRQDLVALLGTDQVYLHPFDEQLGLAISIDVIRFEPVGHSPAEAELVARWTLRANKQPVASKETVVREPIAGTDGAAVAAALSRTVAQLATELAAATIAADTRNAVSSGPR